MTSESLFISVHHEHVERLRSLPVEVDTDGMRLGRQYVMFFAEGDLMNLHARALLGDRPGACVLEVGLGLGVFATQAACYRIASYTAIEPHEEVAALTSRVVLDRLGVPVTVHTMPWQLTDLPTNRFDAIMYDTWPPDGHADEDFGAFVRLVALPCLRPGGRFSFFSSAATSSSSPWVLLLRNAGPALNSTTASSPQHPWNASGSPSTALTPSPAATEPYSTAS
jgi:spermidine synthase